MSGSSVSIYLPLITSQSDVEDLISEYQAVDLYSAFVGRMLEMIITMELNNDDKLYFDQNGNSLRALNRTLGKRILEGKARSNGLEGQALEYTLMEAFNQGMYPVYDELCLALYRILPQTRKYNWRSLSDVTDALGDLNCRAVIFGAEKQTRHSGGLIAYTVNQIPLDGVIYHASRGRNALLVPGLKTIQEYYDHNKPPFGSLEKAIERAVQSGGLPNGLIGLAKADLIVGDLNLNQWVGIDVKTDSADHVIQEGVYIYVALRGKPRIFTSNQPHVSVLLNATRFPIMFSESWAFINYYLKRHQDKPYLPATLWQLKKELNARVDWDIAELIEYLIQPVGQELENVLIDLTDEAQIYEFGRISNKPDKILVSPDIG